MRVWRTLQRSTIAGETFNTRAFSTTRIPRNIAARLDRLDDEGDAGAIVVEGWVRSVRKQKNVAFAAISDGSTVDSLQAVLRPEDAAEITAGTAVKLKGNWKASAGSKQSHELQVSTIEILGENDAESNPLQPKYQTADYLRTIPHLRARTPNNALLLRLRSHLIAALTNFFNGQDFVQTHTPIITSSDCEGAGEVFTVSSHSSEESQQREKPRVEAQVEHFFRTPKYLTVSAQLHLEALAQAVTKVWTLSPTFRAEESDTPRHLSEFYMLEAEMCFVRDLNEIMDLVENMLRSAVTHLQGSKIFNELLKSKEAASKETSPSDATSVTAEIIEQRWTGLLAGPWPRITYTAAISTLQTAYSSKPTTFKLPPSYKTGLQAEHERYIATTIGQGKPVFVTDYPRAQKPFYMLPSPSESTPNTPPSSETETVSTFDLLVPDVCELAGGSLREHRSEALLEAMKRKGVAGGNLDWYLDLRRYGSVPHGGFGLGFDRLLCYLAGVGNVRDVVAFPRWCGRCDC